LSIIVYLCYVIRAGKSGKYRRLNITGYFGCRYAPLDILTVEAWLVDLVDRFRFSILQSKGHFMFFAGMALISGKINQLT